MQKNPLFSIVTITWNAENLVRPTVESIALQTCRDFEHIIIDGASVDGTIDVIKKYSSVPPRIISEKDNGIYDAMNKGLKAAKGKYVIFMNAGDQFDNDDTLALYEKAARNSDPDIIYGDTVIIDSGRNVIGPRHLSVPEKLTFRSFAKGMLVCHQSFMVKRDLAPEYDTRYRFSADYDWTVKCIRATSPDKCVNLHSVVTRYLADGTTDRNMIPSLKERFRIMTRYYGFIPVAVRHIGFLLRFALRKIRK